MKEFTLKIFYSNYYGNYDEFYDYLYSLNGMDNVSLTSFDEYLIIDVFYDEKIINDEIIKYEILTFLDLNNQPVMASFNRHAKEKVITIKKTGHDLCEFCFGNMIYYLYDIKGIEKVESNFYEIYNNSSGGEADYNIEICYDPKIISKEKWEKIEKDIDIYL